MLPTTEAKPGSQEHPLVRAPTFTRMYGRGDLKRDHDKANKEDGEMDEKTPCASYVQTDLREEYTITISTQLEKAANALSHMKNLVKSVEESAMAGASFIKKTPPVHPEYASRGMGKALMQLESVVEALDKFNTTWGVSMRALQEPLTEAQFLGPKLSDVYYGSESEQ